MSRRERVHIDDPFDPATVKRLLRRGDAGGEWEVAGPGWVYAPGPCWLCLVERLRRNGWERRSRGELTPPAPNASPARGRLLTLKPRREHAVAPLPACPRCRPLPGFACPEDWISPLTGIVRSVSVEEAWPGFYVAEAELSQILYPLPDGRWIRGQRQQVSGHGLTAEAARRSCLFEAAERHSLLWHADEDLVLGSFAELGARRAVSPRMYLHYSARQYRERAQWRDRHASFQWVPEPFDPAAPRLWTWVERLGSRPARRLAPAALCFLGLPDPSIYSDTNGGAAGATPEDAVAAGVRELAERDAVALWWYSRARRPAARASASEAVAAFAEILRRERRRCWLLDLTHDLGIPVAVAVSCAMDGSRIALGAAGGRTHRDAIERAAGEMLTIYYSLRDSTAPPPVPAESFSNAAALERWFHSATLEAYPFLQPSRAPRCPARPGAEHEVQAWVKWRTRRDLGIPVARVLAPGLRHWWARLGPGRLYDVPPRLGWTARRLREHELNPEPFLL